MNTRAFRDTWRDRRVKTVLLAIVGAFHVIVAAALLPGDEPQPTGSALFYHAPLLLTLVVIVGEIWRGGRHERSGFVTLAAFIVCWEAAAWVQGGPGLRAADGTLNGADLLVYLGYGLAVASVLRLAPASGIYEVVRALDVAVVAIVAAALAGQYVLPEALARGHGADGLSALGYPLFDFGVLAFLVISFTGDVGGARVRTLLLAGAWAAFSATDTLVATNGSSAVPPAAFDLIRLGATWVIAVAVLAGDDVSVMIDQRDQRLVAFAQTALPFGLLAPLVVLTSAHSVVGEPVPVLTIGTFAAASLLLGRQWLLAADSRNLYAHRERLVASLNTRTAELGREIVERKRAEIALRRSEERFRAVAEHLDEGLFLMDPDGRIVYANPTMAYLSGLDRSDFIGRRANEVLEPWETWAAIIEDVGGDADGAPTRHEARGLTYDGRHVWIEGYSRTFREEGDQEPGTIGIAIDITGRKAAEEETRSRAEELARHNEALERLSSSTAFSQRGLEAAILEIADVAAATLAGKDVGIWLLEEDSRRLRQVALAPTGRTHDQRSSIDLAAFPAYAAALSSDRVVAVSDTGSDPRVAELRAQAILGEGVRSILDAPVRLLGRTVGVIRCEHEGAPRTWSAAEESLFASLAGFTATVLEADKRQEALIGAARLAAVLGATPDFVAIWDANGRAIYVNESARHLLEMDATTDPTTITLESFHPADVILELRRTAIPGAFATGHWSGESAVLAPDGRRIPVSQVILAHRDGGAARYLATIMRDLSESRRAAEERERLNQKLQEAQKLESLGLLAGGIAHDFNNLLQAILGNAQIARMSIMPGDEPAHESLAELETAALRAGDLVRQLLAFAGGGRTGVSPTDPSSLVEETVRLLLAVVTRHASLRLALGEDLPRIEADPVQLRQVVMNLVTNAADAIGESGGTIEVRTRVLRATRSLLRDCFLGETLPAGEYVAIEVEDNGVGMDPATLARIFDPFFTTKHYGHGLGLAAVLGIVRSHAGALRVQSEPGTGTTFTILLPPMRGEARSQSPAAEAAA